MEKLADISKFQHLINESNRTLVENGAWWNKAKKGVIPIVVSAAIHGLPNYLKTNEVYAPETPIEVRSTLASPEVRKVATELYMNDHPLSNREMCWLLPSRFGPDYRSKLSSDDIKYLCQANQDSIGRAKAVREREERLEKRRQEEKELEEIYAGKRPYPEIVDEDFQRKILEYGKPIM